MLHISQGWLSFWHSSHPFAIFWYTLQCFCLQIHVIRLTFSENLWAEWVSGAWQQRHLSIYHLPKNTNNAGVSIINCTWEARWLYHNFLNPFAAMGTSVTHKLLCFYKVSIFLKQICGEALSDGLSAYVDFFWQMGPCWWIEIFSWYIWS